MVKNWKDNPWLVAQSIRYQATYRRARWKVTVVYIISIVPLPDTIYDHGGYALETVAIHFYFRTIPHWKIFEGIKGKGRKLVPPKVTAKVEMCYGFSLQLTVRLRCVHKNNKCNNARGSHFTLITITVKGYKIICDGSSCFMVCNKDYPLCQGFTLCVAQIGFKPNHKHVTMRFKTCFSHGIHARETEEYPLWHTLELVVRKRSAEKKFRLNYNLYVAIIYTYSSHIVWNAWKRPLKSSCLLHQNKCVPSQITWKEPARALQCAWIAAEAHDCTHKQLH